MQRPVDYEGPNQRPKTLPISPPLTKDQAKSANAARTVLGLLRGKPMIRAFLIALFLIVGAGSTDAAEISGRVVGVTDGDTLTLLTPQRRQLTIRLTEIDAPESGQPWGGRSRGRASQPRRAAGTPAIDRAGTRLGWHGDEPAFRGRHESTRGEDDFDAHRRFHRRARLQTS